MGCIDIDSFARSRTRFGEIVGFLDGDRAGALSHADLEDRLDSEGRELLRLYQDHLDLRAGREQRLGEVLDADGLDRPSVEAGHAQTLTTIFGEVTVTRLAYRRRHQPNLHPVDAALNLPDERHSHGLRRLAASEAARGSFDDAAGAIRSRTGTSVGKRQVEELTARAATDFAAFHSSRPRPQAAPEEVVVLSVDAKGIVMRPDALRPATAKAATASTNKLETRLSNGEKRNRKRMAEVGAVYTVVPVSRAGTDVLASGDGTGERKAAPTAKDKWLTASVLNDVATVVTAVFDEAERRDPTHQRRWVALVDGNSGRARLSLQAATRKAVTVAPPRRGEMDSYAPRGRICSERLAEPKVCVRVVAIEEHLSAPSIHEARRPVDWSSPVCPR